MSTYTKEGLEKRRIKALNKFLEKAKNKFGERYGYELIEHGINKQEKIPFVYRCHDKPDIEKIALFRVFIDKFGYELNYTSPDEISKAIKALSKNSVSI